MSTTGKSVVVIGGVGEFGVCQARDMGPEKRLMRALHLPGEHSRFPDFKFNPSLEASGRTRRVVFLSGNQEIRKGPRCRGIVLSIVILKKLRYYNNAWQSHAERVGRPGPWPLPRAQGIAPLQRGGRARRAAAEYQPGYDGLPGGAQGLRALRLLAPGS